jgi:ribonuclease Z
MCDETAPINGKGQYRKKFFGSLQTQRQPCAISYICQGPTVPGKFDAAKALELGVPNGPLRGQLCKGQSIITKDGKEVHPADCIGPAKPGHVSFKL